MKDKKVFGAFIKEKRLEKKYSQKELADLLFVGESAVSKWERGVTYPDITLIKDICRILEITEHELIESSDDTEYRNMKKDAKKFNSLKKGFFWTFTICYILALITCFIVNLAVNHKLSWFFIVLVSIICAYTFCPTFTWFFKKYKKIIFIGSTFISLFLLFLTCSIYTNNYWFMIATFGTFLGYFIICYPILTTEQKKYLDEEKYNKLTKLFLFTYMIGILIIICLLLVSIYCYKPFNLGLGIVITCGCLTIPIIFGILKCFSVSRKVQKMFLCSIVIALVVFFVFSVFSTINLMSNNKTNTYLIENSYQDVKIEVENYNINFYASENGENKIVYTENEKIFVDIKVENNILVIKQIDSRKFYEKMFGFGKQFKIDLYLSNKKIDKLSFSGATGNVNVNDGLTFNNIDINNSTGNIKIESDVVDKLNVNNATGNILLNNSNLGSVNLKTSTGNIDLDKINCNDLDIEISTGNTKLSDVIVVANFFLEGTTGDVIFDRFDACEIYIKVSTGDVKGSILSSKFIVAKSTTGDVIVPTSREGGNCKITTTTGNIIISFIENEK